MTENGNTELENERLKAAFKRGFEFAEEEALLEIAVRTRSISLKEVREKLAFFDVATIGYCCVSVIAAIFISGAIGVLDLSSSGYGLFEERFALLIILGIATLVYFGIRVLAFAHVAWVLDVVVRRSNDPRRHQEMRNMIRTRLRQPSTKPPEGLA